MFSTEKGFIRYLEGKMSPYKLNEKGKSTARQLYSRFSCDLLKEATEISFSQYLRFDEEGNPTEESVGVCFQKIGGIAHNKTLGPIDAAIGHILAIGQKSYSYWNDYSARDTIRTYITALGKAGFSDAEIANDLEKEVVPLIKNSANWSAWCSRMAGWTEDVLSWNAEDKIEQNQSIIPDELYSGTRGYIEKISMQINASYEKNLYDCCAVMLRRLMEVLLVLSFQKNGVEDLIMDKGNLYHVSLDKMINIASSCSELSLSASTKKDMHTIKDLGNYSAHRIWYNCTKKDIEPNIMKYRAIIEELMYKSGIKE